jgi:spermidine synthase
LGFTTREIAKRNTDSDVTGIDINQYIIDLAVL